jgi:hypothetical protein
MSAGCAETVAADRAANDAVSTAVVTEIFTGEVHSWIEMANAAHHKERTGALD